MHICTMHICTNAHSYKKMARKSGGAGNHMPDDLGVTSCARLWNGWPGMKSINLNLTQSSISGTVCLV